MIEFLRGTVLESDGGHLVVEVNGIGYGLDAPTATVNAIGPPGSESQLWVRTYVREDTLRLYGFATRQERQVFDIMLGFSGVGPAIGLALLSQLNVREIVQAVLSGDVQALRKVKGIGPKMADKLMLELKSRVEQLAAGLDPSELETAGEASEPTSDAARDAVAALEALDVRPAQARRAIALAMEAIGPDAPTEKLVREGLKHRHAAR